MVENSVEIQWKCIENNVKATQIYTSSKQLHSTIPGILQISLPARQKSVELQRNFIREFIL